MKKILLFIFLGAFVVSCTTDESDELIFNEIQKIEQKGKGNIQYFAKDGDTTSAVNDTIVPPPPPVNPGSSPETCDNCSDIDPPKGNTGGIGSTKP